MASERLKGKTAVVTAAASGIGRASAEAFRDAGARVIGIDIDAAALKTLQGCEGVVVDVRKPEAIASFAGTAGRVDVLFNCAGMVPNGTVLDIGFADWQTAFDLNVNSMYHMIRAFLPGMVGRSRARSSTCRQWRARSRACRTVVRMARPRRR